MKDRNRIVLDKYELDKLFDFMIEHHAKHDNTEAMIIETSGGSGIGTNVYIICGQCQEEKDISDYASW